MTAPASRVVEGVTAEAQASAWARIAAMGATEDKVVMTGAELNGAAAGLAATLAVVIDPVARLPVVAGQVRESFPESDGRRVVGGEGTTREALALLDPSAAGLADAERERRQYANALCAALHDFGGARTYDRAASRPAGVPVAWIIAGAGAAIVVVGYAVTAFLEHRERLVRIERQQATQAAAVQRAADLYVERLRTWRATGTMPAASEQERAAADAVRAAATEGRTALQAATEGVTSAAKWVTVALALYAARNLFL